MVGSDCEPVRCGWIDQPGVFPFLAAAVVESPPGRIVIWLSFSKQLALEFFKIFVTKCLAGSQLNRQSFVLDPRKTVGTDVEAEQQIDILVFDSESWSLIPKLNIYHIADFARQAREVAYSRSGGLIGDNGWHCE